MPKQKVPASKNHQLNPSQLLLLGFAVVILIGSFLLSLPFATKSGVSISFYEAFFTATSATCVTGYSLFDAASMLSIFGQIVLLVLIQIGGLGIMTASLALFFATGRRISFKSRLALRESMGEASFSGIIKLAKRALLATLSFELFGFIVLSLRFYKLFGSKGIWHGLFLSISAFCNAGWDLLPNGFSLIPYQNDPIVLFTIAFLVIAGSLGFVVLYDLFSFKHYSQMSIHSKMVLLMTFFLGIVAFLLYFLFEFENPKTMGELSLPSKLMNSFFQSITTRTAGFTTLNQGEMTDASHFLSIVLMFIGGSPASTGGGIKTTTFGLLILVIVTVARGKSDIDFAGRKIAWDMARKAIVILCLYLLALVVFILTICFIEAAPRDNITLSNICFEVVSTFGTTGLSTGVIYKLTFPSQLLFVFGMYVGRLGPLTLAIGLMNKKSTGASVHYPEGRLLIG